ncbi:hypothetical protein H696_04707 [Fonticula alba]|uniref:Uncharacterized protein n=1 Tax=Fonticula alba TaxID=691883 RepID=A0A058Z3B4_FONAL|nr:hypothetical protein H696_04707 [Fonticula alba]KCV68413.1 hypothetical protein H696_04707 [Fonticula alba]|eukprot:XP_009496845.1 hypothetical protein H696_04707 [Fonticula alba]
MRAGTRDKETLPGIEALIGELLGKAVTVGLDTRDSLLWTSRRPPRARGKGSRRRSDGRCGRRPGGNRKRRRLTVPRQEGARSGRSGCLVQEQIPGSEYRIRALRPAAQVGFRGGVEGAGVGRDASPAIAPCQPGRRRGPPFRRVLRRQRRVVSQRRRGR